MSKYSFLLWAAVIVLVVLVVDYNYNPQHYIYSNNNDSQATLWVVSDGWRNQPFITTPGTDPFLTSTYIAGREVVYKMPLKHAPMWIKDLNFLGILIMLSMSILVVIKIKDIIYNKKKFKPFD